VNLHLYGKNKTSPYRKMGHITILDKDIKQAAEKAALVKTLITIGAEKNDE
jgi:5-(carboxyamino)imidazole ribonucleotide synthase